MAIRDETKKYIVGLRDADLLEYVLMGKRAYEAEAVAFAAQELDRRTLTPEQLAILRPPVVAKVAAYDAQTPPDENGPSRAAEAILCQSCGYEVPNRYMTFHQNIGAALVRFSHAYKGYFCRECSRKFFWKSTLITFFLGWWGTISFFVSIVFLFGNVIEYLRSMAIPAAQRRAVRPVCDDSVIAKVSPHLFRITEQLNAGRDVAELAREIAPLAGVTPGEVWCFAHAMLRKQDARPNPASVAEFGGLGSLRI